MDANRYAADLPLQGWGAGKRGAASLAFEGAVAEIAVAENGSVRLRAAIGASLPPDPGPSVGREPWRPANARPEPREGGGLRVDCDGPLGSAHVEIDPDPFAVRVLDRRGELVAEIRDLSLAPQGSARCSLASEPGERFFGFGERTGGLDKRGERLFLRNRDPEGSFADPLYVSIPFFIGLRRGPEGPRARGVLLDAFAPSHFDVAAAAEDRVDLETTAGGLDLTVFPGPEPRHVLERFTARVGRSPLPPRWALGHHQSRWSYGNEKEVRALVREIRSRDIPTDVIHLDIDYMEGCRVFTWNPKRFPDPQGLLRDLAHQGFRVVTIIDPGVKADPDDRVYREGRERGLFCENQDGSEFSLRVWPGKAVLPDFNRAEVRTWWGEQHRGLVDAGVAGIWIDMNEPAGWAKDIRAGRAIFPYRKQNLSRVIQRDPADEERRVPHESVRNLYGQQQCRATRAFLERAYPDRRPFLLTRSGHAGIQRSAAVWTGDNRSRWSHLRQSIPMLLNLGSPSAAPTSGASSSPARRSSMRAGSSSALSTPLRAPTACGSGADRNRGASGRASKVSRAALSSFACAFSPTSMGSSERLRSAAPPSGARSSTSFQKIPTRPGWRTSSCSARPCSRRRWSSAAPATAMSTCRRACGCRGTTTRATSVRAECGSPLRWNAHPCSRAAAR
jgi:hypothetical protein